MLKQIKIINFKQYHILISIKFNLLHNNYWNACANKSNSASFLL